VQLSGTIGTGVAELLELTAELLDLAEELLLDVVAELLDLTEELLLDVAMELLEDTVAELLLDIAVELLDLAELLLDVAMELLEDTIAKLLLEPGSLSGSKIEPCLELQAKNMKMDAIIAKKSHIFGEYVRIFIPPE